RRKSSNRFRSLRISFNFRSRANPPGPPKRRRRPPKPPRPRRPNRYWDEEKVPPVRFRVRSLTKTIDSASNLLPIRIPEEVRSRLGPKKTQNLEVRTRSGPKRIQTKTDSNSKWALRKIRKLLQAYAQQNPRYLLYIIC